MSSTESVPWPNQQYIIDGVTPYVDVPQTPDWQDEDLSVLDTPEANADHEKVLEEQDDAGVEVSDDEE